MEKNNESRKEFDPPKAEIKNISIKSIMILELMNFIGLITQKTQKSLTI